MPALYQSGVQFREIKRPGGVVVTWRPRELPAWEQPLQDPSIPHPLHPEGQAQHREARARQRAAKAAREARRMEQASVVQPVVIG